MSERREQLRFQPEERRLIAALEEGLPLVPAPYHELARRLGLDPAWVLETVGRWVREGVIRRLGATVRHHRVGYTFNCMVAWRLDDPSRHREAGERLAEFPEVTHCYRRPPFPGWPYTLYTMVHGGSEQELLGTVRRMAEAAGLKDYRLLHSQREWKKSSARYFSAGQEADQ